MKLSLEVDLTNFQLNSSVCIQTHESPTGGGLIRSVIMILMPIQRVTNVETTQRHNLYCATSSSIVATRDHHCNKGLIMRMDDLSVTSIGHDMTVLLSSL